MSRLRILTTAVIACLALLAVPALALGQSFHFSSTGKSASAAWSTFPTEGAADPRVVYVDTFVFAAEQAVRADGTRYDDKFLFLNQYSYRVDRNGDYQFISETYGFAGGADVNLAIDRRLTSAEASAALQLTSCTTSRRGDYRCTDGGAADVAVSWTGQGPLNRVSGTFRTSSKSSTYVSRFTGSFREAVAVGQLNGTSLGSSLYAELSHASSRDLFVCHGSC